MGAQHTSQRQRRVLSSPAPCFFCAGLCALAACCHSTENMRSRLLSCGALEAASRSEAGCSTRSTSPPLRAQAACSTASSNTGCIKSQSSATTVAAGRRCVSTGGLVLMLTSGFGPGRACETVQLRISANALVLLAWRRMMASSSVSAATRR